jgi:uncharacterized phage protein (TIGR02216 family)
MTRRFPWDRLMHLGLGVLRLPPHAFWSATLREIAAAFPARPILPREELDRLMTRYPDRT